VEVLLLLVIVILVVEALVVLSDAAGVAAVELCTGEAFSVVAGVSVAVVAGPAAEVVDVVVVVVVVVSLPSSLSSILFACLIISWAMFNLTAGLDCPIAPVTVGCPMKAATPPGLSPAWTWM
jgi:hypothetical protein